MFKRLPKTEDHRLLMAIARLNNNSDFRLLRDYLEDAPALIASRMKDVKDNQEIHWDQGAMQVLSDQEELFDNAHKWAQDSYNLSLKKADAGT